MKNLLDALFARDEHVCPWWMAWTFDNPLRKWLHDPVRILGPLVGEGMTVADIGCGMGYFSVAMAKLVGPRGSVYAVDLQQKMLQYLLRRADRAGVRDRIRTVLAEPDDIRLDAPVDLVLLFWMAHEVKDLPRFFAQVARVLRPGGTVLYAEPKMHVTQARFDQIVQFAAAAGFSVSAGPRVNMSRTALLRNPS